MADEPHEEGISLKCSANIFAVYVMLYGPSTDFFNIVHLSAIVRHVKCTFPDCFYTHLS